MPIIAPPTLPQLIASELDAVKRFVETLQHEQQALVDGVIDQLLPLAEEKGRIAIELGQLALARNQALAKLNLAADKKGMVQWLSQQPRGNPGRQAWNAIMKLATEARNINQINGKLIATRMQFNQQALAKLHAAVDKAMLYGPDGQQHARSSRLFGSA